MAASSPSSPTESSSSPASSMSSSKSSFGTRAPQMSTAAPRTVRVASSSLVKAISQVACSVPARSVHSTSSGCVAVLIETMAVVFFAAGAASAACFMTNASPSGTSSLCGVCGISLMPWKSILSLRFDQVSRHERPSVSLPTSPLTAVCDHLYTPCPILDPLSTANRAVVEPRRLWLWLWF